MRIVITGPVSSGKTTLFSALAGVPYEEAVVHPPGDRRRTTRCAVSDERMDILRNALHPPKTTPAFVEITDGRAPSSTRGEGAVWGELRNAELLLVVIDAFTDPSRAAAAASSIHSDFLLADLGVLEHRRERIGELLRKPLPDKDALHAELELLGRWIPELEAGRRPDPNTCTCEERDMLRPYALLSRIPTMLVWNVGDGLSASLPWDPAAAPIPGAQDQGEWGWRGAIPVRFEAEVLQLPEEDRAGFLAEGQRLGTPALPAAALATGDRCSFFTLGDELRAWPFPNGIIAWHAAGTIHEDIQRGFIAAEVMSFSDWQAHGGWKEARTAGKMRLEGKNYIVADGDIVHFRFSV